MTHQPPPAARPPEPAPWRPEAAEVEQRAVRGVAMTVGRTLAVQAFTFLGTVALSHLLTPREYGIFAIAYTLQVVGRTLVDLGLPAALIRRREDMSRVEEQTLAAVALVGSTAVAAILVLAAFVVLPLLGLPSPLLRVAAFTSLALPVYSARIIPIIRLERRLEFKRLMWIDVADTAAFYAFAIPAAVAGLGAFSLAGAVVAAAAASSVVATVVGPWSYGLRLDLAWIRPMLGFSLRASSLAPLYLARELVVLVVLAAVGGPAQAGFYNLAQRLFSLNLAIAYAVQRVTQTAFARGEGGATRDRRAAQTAIVSTLAASLPLAMVVGTAHIAVDLVFGTRWHPAVALVLGASLGWLLISGTNGVLTSLALSNADATAPMRAAALQGALAVVLTAILVPALGTLGAGLAVTAGALGSVLVLVASGSRELRVLVAPTARIAAAAALAGAIGASVGGRGVLWLLAAGFACAASWLAAVAVLVPGELRLLARLLRRNLRRGAVVA